MVPVVVAAALAFQVLAVVALVAMVLKETTADHAAILVRPAQVPVVAAVPAAAATTTATVAQEARVSL